MAQAPAGYGKTTLLGQLWRIREPEAFKPWLSLAPGRRGFSRFREDLAGALAFAGLEPPALCGSPEEDGALIGDFLCAQARPVFLTLDNYDAAATPEVDAFVRALAATSHGSGLVAIGARKRPAIGAAALAARGELVRLGPAELSFSFADAKALFDGTLDDEAIASLHEQAEGWPAVLQLARRAFDAQGGRKRASPVRATGGEMGAYLAEETFDPLHQELKAFLIETALLETLDAEAADLVRQRHDSAALLEDLENSGALVFPVSGEHPSLRRHRLLKAFLAARFALLAPDVRIAIGERTIEFLSRQGSLKSALSLALRLDPARPLLSPFEAAPSASIWSAEALMDVAGELVDLDEASLSAEPRLAALRVVGLHRLGRTTEARRSADAAPAALRARAARIPPRRAPEAEFDVQLWNGLRAALFDETIPQPALAQLAEAARNVKPAGTQAAMAHAASVLTLRAGCSAGARALARLGEAAAQQADIPDRILALTTLALAALYDGALEEASEALRQAQGIAAPQKTRAAYQAALGVCASLLRRERGEARSASPPADGASLLGFSPEILVESARLAAISALRDSGYGAARGHLKRAREAAVACLWRRAETALLAEELVLAARGGEHRAAASLAQEIKKLGGNEAPEGVLALATFEIEKGANAAARVRLAALLSRELPRRWRMRGLILDARAAAALAARGDASASLARYLALCGEGVMAAAFFEDGAALWDELLDIASRLAPMGQRDRRLDAVADLAIARAHFVDGAPLAAPTDQEVAMLAALRRSGARAEAARTLEMSENTLKFYLKRVFQKWRINDWRLAVRVAERMGALGETHREREAVV